MYGTLTTKTITHMAEQAITTKELDELKQKIYVGMPVVMCDSYNRMRYTHQANHKYKTNIKTWYPNVIVMENGMTCTMVEMAKYLRDKSRALCS